MEINHIRCKVVESLSHDAKLGFNSGRPITGSQRLTLDSAHPRLELNETRIELSPIDGVTVAFVSHSS